MRRGTTLFELVMVLTLIGLLSALAAPHVVDTLDRLAVRKAVGEAAMFYGAARFGAILRGSRVRIEFGADSMIAVYERAKDSLFLRRDGASKDPGRVRGFRAVVRNLPTRIRRGGAHTTLVFQPRLPA